MPKGPRNGPVVRSVIAPASPPAPVSRPTSAPAIEAVAVFPPPESPALDAALALPHEVRYEATLMELAHLMRLIVRLGTEAKQSGDTDYLTDLRGLYRATDSVRNFYEDMADGGWHDD